MNDKYFVLLISHKFGNTVSVHRTRKGARNELYQYVKDNWAELSQLTTAKLPRNKSTAISYYFETRMELGPDIESYEISHVKLLP